MLAFICRVSLPSLRWCADPSSRYVHHDYLALGASAWRGQREQKQYYKNDNNPFPFASLHLLRVMAVFQFQLTGQLDLSLDVDMYNIDLFGE